MRARAKRCEWYRNEKSCFDCPYPDCIWNAKEVIPTTEKPDKLTVYKERLEDRVRLLGVAVAKGDSAGARRLRCNIRYYKKCISELEMKR